MTQKVRTVLVDLSGTLHVENEEIPGSIEALARQDRDVGQLIKLVYARSLVPYIKQ